MAHKIKRIIDGKTYNTETATLIEGRDGSEHFYDEGEFLYKSRFGAFFFYRYLTGMDEHDYEKIEPATPEQAREWLEKNYSYQPELIETHFWVMPEAGSGEAKYTLRMPDTLRDRLAARAKENGQSLNAWIVRCLEGCAGAEAKGG